MASVKKPTDRGTKSKTKARRRIPPARDAVIPPSGVTHLLSDSEMQRLMDEARAKVAAGEFMVEAFTDTLKLPTGRVIKIPEVVKHPVLQSMEDLAQRLSAMRSTNNPMAIAAAHIVSALARAIRRRDEAGLKGAHAWAAAYLKPDDPADLDGAYVPVLDKLGRIHPGLAAPFSALSARMRLVVACDRDGGWAYADGSLLDGAEVLAPMLVLCFPSIASLAKADVRQVESSLRVSLPKFLRDTKALSLDAAAETIAEGILRKAMADSGKSGREIERAMSFRRQRRFRRDYA